MKPAKRDIDPDAKSHEGEYDGFSILWLDEIATADGWYYYDHGVSVIGPFHTSQAAFGAVKDAID